MTDEELAQIEAAIRAAREGERVTVDFQQAPFQRMAEDIEAAVKAAREDQEMTGKQLLDIAERLADPIDWKHVAVQLAAYGAIYQGLTTPERIALEAELQRQRIPAYGASWAEQMFREAQRRIGWGTPAEFGASGPGGSPESPRANLAAQQRCSGRHVGRDQAGACYSCGVPVEANKALYCPSCGYAYPCQCPGQPSGPGGSLARCPLHPDDAICPECTG